MCGVCGIYSFVDTVNTDRLRAMCQKMKHRGPNDMGMLATLRAGIAMRRLSIIDIDGGHQPVTNEDNSIAVVLNGEIYNYKELRDDLVRQGHRFKTNTDTEVIVHLYEEYGFRAVDYLNGMFAIILWDTKKDIFWVVRDRIGIKPLYYRFNAEEFLCASDLNAVNEAMERALKIDKESFLNYLVMGYIPKEKSIYTGVKKLLPGKWMVISRDGCRTEQYWCLPQKTIADISLNEAKKKLLNLLRDAIRLQRRSDVAIGTFLSGGMDSSAVVALLAEQSNNPVRTFTVNFIGKNNNEAMYAREIAKRFGTQHTEIDLTPEMFGQAMAAVMPYMDEPIADSAVFPSYLLSKIAHESGVKVILNGTGADEIFGGYPRHAPYTFHTKYYYVKMLPSWLRLCLGAALKRKSVHFAEVLIDERLFFGTAISGIDLGLLKGVLIDNHDYEYCLVTLREMYADIIATTGHSYYQKMRNDFNNYLVGDILALLDKTTMACSIEGRVPLIDHRIVEFAYMLPEYMNTYGGKLKGLFREVMQDILPESVINRPKEGFNAPVGLWTNAYLGSGMLDSFSQPCEYLNDFIDLEKCCYFMQKKPQKLTSKESEMLFILYMFKQWHVAGQGV